MKITICVGGSVFAPQKIGHEIFEQFADILKLLKKQNHEIYVVTGGGNTARAYIETAKKLGAPEGNLDHLGIMATRMNARLLISALGEDALPDPPRNFETAVRSSLKNKIPVMGGTTTGHTTDAVAAELAEDSDSDLLIFFTDVDGVYTSDPKKDVKAEKIKEMSTKGLSKLMSKMDFEPGMKAVIDPFAAEIIQKNRIKTLVLSRKEIENLPAIIEGASHSGTEIVPS